MIRVALRGLAGRKFRASLTALAIVLGVAMVCGTYVLTDTINRGFDTIFTASYKNTDAVITSKASFSTGDGDTASAPFAEDLLPKIERLPSVGAAVGGVEDDARLIDRDGDVLGTGQAPTIGLGIDVDADERFNPLSLTEGAWPRGLGQVVIDKASADDGGFRVGDVIRVATRGPTREFSISGIAVFGGVSSIGGATFAVFDISTAQRLFEKEGQLDLIRVAAKPNVEPEELVREIRPVLPATAKVETATVQAESDAAETSEFLGIFQKVLLAFGGIALFVGSFVIANTLSITIAQRVREFATLRTLGGSRRQILLSVILEALVVGVLASVIGLLAGLGLAVALSELFTAIGFDLPKGDTVFRTRTAVVSLAAGILVTVLASLRPALRATRVPPIAAVREGSVLPPSRLARFGALTALLVLALGLGLLLYGVFGSGMSVSTRLIALGVGCLLLFLGVALVAPKLVRPLASVLGWPATRIGGVAGSLARENSMRNPGRTASTAAALMIGLALVTFVGVLGFGLRKSFEDAVDKLFVADYAITADAVFAPVAPDAGEAASGAPSVQVVSGIRQGAGRIGGGDVFVTGVDEHMSEVIDLDWKAGSDALPARLGESNAFVRDEYADDKNLSIGSTLELETPSAKVLTLKVIGIFEEPEGGSPFGDVTISTRTFDASFPQPTNLMTFVNTAGGVSADNTARLELALTAFPDVKVLTAAEFKQAALAPLDRLLNVLYVLLALSVIVSAFGIVNTLVLTVFERTRELGMLRAVGMTRRQVRRMIRHESIVTSLIGAVLGIAIGIFLAFLITQALAEEGFVFAIPYSSLVVFMFAAIVVGLIAAILPARRAARLNVLQALQYE